MVRVFAYSADGRLAESQGASALRRIWAERPHRLWVDLEDPTDEEVDLLLEVFDFHPAAVRDVRTHTELPKMSAYDGYSFLVLHRVFYHFENEICELRDFSVFFSDAFVVTVHRSHLSRTFASVADLVRDDPARMLGGVTSPVLIHLLEAVIHDYGPVLEQWQEKLEELEQLVLQGSQKSVLEEILTFKKLSAALRKNLFPQKTVLLQLYERSRPAHIGEANRPYFKNVLDEMGGLLRELESLSNHAASVFDVYAAVLNLEMARSSHRLSFVMQRLNVMMSIFMPLTFIVGVYGMNIQDIPELKWRGFYFVLWGFMAVLTMVMLYLFKKMKWY